MLTIVVALASKAEFTFLDEPVAGLDVVARDQFYRILLDEFTEGGRTFVISTHIIEEAEDLFEEVIFLHKGEILLKDGNPIQAYYFSTSHGKTSTDEVWETASPASYLKSVDCTYDSQEPWYQWEVLVSKENILKNVQQLLPEVKEVQRVEIVEKGEGDAVLHLKVETEQGAKSFYSEYDIRSVLAPLGAEIIRQDGSSVKGGKLLPSAYFTMEEQTDTAGVWTGYQIKGGGYGHGVGTVSYTHLTLPTIA